MMSTSLLRHPPNSRVLQHYECTLRSLYNVKHFPALIQKYITYIVKPNIVHILVVLRGYKICFKFPKFDDELCYFGNGTGVCQLVDFGHRRIIDQEVVLNLKNVVNIHHLVTGKSSHCSRLITQSAS
jgi:uncharacterized protein Usg